LKTLKSHGELVQEMEETGDITCPKCEDGTLLKGPKGGEAMNVKCDVCGEVFWLAPMCGLREL